MGENRDLAEWTIMVYLAGDNNLTEEMVLALQDIKDLHLNEFSALADQDPNFAEKNKIVAQFDPSGLGMPTHRYDFGKKPKGKAEYLEDWRVRIRRKDIQWENTGNPDAACYSGVGG